MSKPRLAFAWAVLKTWPRSDADLEERPCLHAPPCPASAFSCRPDWRLNLVLSAGNCGSSDALPVFEATDEASFDAAVQRAVDRTLLCCGSVGGDVVELPYNLSRYRGDLPGGCDREGSERRWAELLAPGSQAGAAAVYRKEYSWSMRERLELLAGA
ncbi:unnamed protein product [Prorocentrum cordatum]|uniref:Subtilisin n=1 Tax=Prorocentrum cordatum TaxID=2364126 RepID=A0ABN9XDA2_9DINO|nr:unnamed protein product [Polarella glacialis]